SWTAPACRTARRPLRACSTSLPRCCARSASRCRPTCRGTAWSEPATRPRREIAGGSRPGYRRPMPVRPSKRRQIARVREIAHVAARHGFGYAFERRGRRVSLDEPDVSLESRGRHLREMLDELGPTFVKFGQLLSL